PLERRRGRPGCRVPDRAGGHAVERPRALPPRPLRPRPAGGRGLDFAPDPRRNGMKLFVDTANLEELEECLKRGFPSGVTTNPAILSKEQRRDFRLHINDMIALLQKYGAAIPLSVEVFTTDAEEMLTQAEEFVGHFGHYPHLNVKVPVG